MKSSLIKSLAILMLTFFAQTVFAQQDENAPAGFQRPDLSLEAQAMEPFRMFDNLYYVGVDFVGAFLIPTSDGLILIDTLLADYGEYILENVRKTGFDPADIKYAVVTHGHHDHYGGAALLQRELGTQIVATAEDWELVRQDLGEQAPRLDIEVTDNDLLTLGDTTLNFIKTPGHTPGVLSFSMTVYEGDQAYRAFSFSGAGLGQYEGALDQFKQSVETIKSLGPIDVNIINHAFLVPGYLDKRELLATRIDGDPNPYVLAEGEYEQWLSARLEAAMQ